MAAASLALWVVTGAPGAGKSVIAEALLAYPSEALIFDIDWLTLPVSALVGQSIVEACPLWPAYNRLWFAILEMVASISSTGDLLLAPRPRRRGDCLGDDAVRCRPLVPPRLR